MVEGLILPERSSLPAEYAIRLPRGTSLQRTEGTYRFHERLDEHVNVVGHDHKRVYLIVCTGFSSIYRVQNARSHSRILEPLGPLVCSLQLPIHCQEKVAR